MDDVTTTAYRFGAYLKDNTGTLSIDPSNFSNSGYAGLYVTGQDGKIVLDDVTADNNGKSVADTTLDPSKFLYPDLASGAAFMNNKGALIIKDSEFNGNATAGLWVQARWAELPLKKPQPLGVEVKALCW